jgi:acetylornithine/succinyldiaminopimelate/putrescine aminotransferase
MAKPLANGFPIGAILASSAIAEEIKIGDHGNLHRNISVLSQALHLVETLLPPVWHIMFSSVFPLLRCSPT